MKIEPQRPTDAEIRKRQRSRAVVMGLALAAVAVLLYAVTVARIGLQ